MSTLPTRSVNPARRSTWKVTESGRTLKSPVTTTRLITRMISYRIRLRVKSVCAASVTVLRLSMPEFRLTMG